MPESTTQAKLPNAGDEAAACNPRLRFILRCRHRIVLWALIFLIAPAPVTTFFGFALNGNDVTGDLRTNLLFTGFIALLTSFLAYLALRQTVVELHDTRQLISHRRVLGWAYGRVSIDAAQIRKIFVEFDSDRDPHLVVETSGDRHVLDFNEYAATMEIVAKRLSSALDLEQRS
jgi:hypothetical protein